MSNELLKRKRTLGKEQYYTIPKTADLCLYVLLKHIPANASSCMDKKSQDKFRKQMLEKQGGLCAFCRRGNFCSKCHRGLEHNKPDGCPIQPVNTMDHNHACCQEQWCEKCARGMVHRVCNRSLAIIEANLHLQNDFTKAYLSQGFPASSEAGN